MKREPFTVRLDPRLKTAIDVVSARHGLKFGEVIEALSVGLLEPRRMIAIQGEIKAEYKSLCEKE